jgi:hypothetical protein
MINNHQTHGQQSSTNIIKALQTTWSTIVQTHGQHSSNTCSTIVKQHGTHHQQT